MNRVYNKYKEKCSIIERYYGSHGAAKLKGVLVASTFKEEIERILIEYKLEGKIKISENNSYILGHTTEFDFLLLKKEAKRVCDLPIYEVDDVLAIIESKTNGVMDFDYKGESRSLKLLADSFNKIWNINSDIRFGYMTMAERRPRDPNKRDSWENTSKCFETYIENNALSISFAASLHHTYGKPFEYGTDEEWVEFVLTLAGKRN